MWTLKTNGTKELIHKTERVTGAGNKPSVTRGEGRWGGGRWEDVSWEAGIDIYTLHVK